MRDGMVLFHIVLLDELAIHIRENPGDASRGVAIIEKNGDLYAETWHSDTGSRKAINRNQITEGSRFDFFLHPRAKREIVGLLDLPDFGEGPIRLTELLEEYLGGQ